MIDIRTAAARVVALALLLSCCSAMQAQQGKALLKTSAPMYVGTMGDSEKAEDFRAMVGYELGRAGFKVTDFRQQTDKILTGLLAIREEGRQSRVRVTVFLKTADGKTLWTGDFGASSGPMRIEDAMRRRATEIATSLRKQFPQYISSFKKEP